MFVAPWVSPDAFNVSQRSQPSHPRSFSTDTGIASAATAVAALWFVLGLCAYALIPMARGDDRFGATLPFWLVIAPLLNLLWLQRSRGWPLLRSRLRRSFRRNSSAPARRLRAVSNARRPIAACRNSVRVNR